MTKPTDITRIRKMEEMGKRLPWSNADARKAAIEIAKRQTDPITRSRDDMINDIMYDDPDMSLEAAEWYADNYLQDEWE